MNNNNICIGCDSIVRDREMLCCSICNKVCHYTCAGLNISAYQKMSSSNRANWKCINCKLPKKRKGDETPVRETPSDTELESSPTTYNTQLPSQQSSAINIKDIESYLNKQFKCFSKTIKNDIATFKNDIVQRLDEYKTEKFNDFKQLSLNISRIESQQKEILNSQKQIESTLASLSNFYDDLKNNNIKLEKDIVLLKRENNKKSKQILELEIHIEDIQRTICSKSIEVRSVPLNDNENLHTYLQLLCKSINFHLEEHALVSAYRTRPSHSNGHIVYEFSNQTHKHKLLNAIKSYNKKNPEKVNTSNIGLTSKNNLYISELLPKKTKQLYYKTREQAKLAKFQYCWTKNGRIYLRKSQGDAAIPIRSEQQLQDILKPDSAAPATPLTTTDTSQID